MPEITHAGFSGRGYRVGSDPDRAGWAFAEVGGLRREWQLAPHENLYGPFGNYALRLAWMWAEAEACARDGRS
jgi:hypothetical protein